MHLPTAETLTNRLGAAAPWWIGLGLTGVTVAIVSGQAPLLSSLALVGIGSDADLGRRLREAMAAGVANDSNVDPAIVAAFMRRVHAGMYAVLIVFAWASLLHLAGTGESAMTTRYWLAADIGVAAFMALGYARLARRTE